jgi:hypothetical protein
MATPDERQQGYGCMQPPPDARFVHEPHDERILEHGNPVRRLFARLASAFRRQR